MKAQKTSAKAQDNFDDNDDIVKQEPLDSQN